MLAISGQACCTFTFPARCDVAAGVAAYAEVVVGDVDTACYCILYQATSPAQAELVAGTLYEGVTDKADAMIGAGFGVVVAHVGWSKKI